MSDIAAGYNLLDDPQPCVMCGKTFIPPVGPAAFWAGTEQLVCRTCADQHAPEVAALIFDD